MTHDWRNAMIEEAAKAIREVRTVTFRGEDGYLSVGSVDAETLARAALAVFAKAHTPTDDERALAKRLVARHLPLSAPSDTAANIVRHLTEVGLLRRSEVPEPSADDAMSHYTDPADPFWQSNSEPQGEPSDASTCDHCGGEAWHHTVECFTGAKPLQEAISRLENCLSNRDAGIGAWSMVQPEDVRTVLSALRAAGSSR